MKHKQRIIDGVKKSVIAAQENFDFQLFEFKQPRLSIAVDRAFNNMLLDCVRDYKMYFDNDKNEVDMLISRCRKIFASRVAFAIDDALDECREVFSGEMEKLSVELQDMIEEKG